jgi:DNA-binding IscR family transcriptional regulator
MAESGRFRVAVHVLTLLAHDAEHPLTSDYIAGSVNTNPVVVRRMIGQLKHAGLVRVTEGAGGGAALARPPARITLLDAYRASAPGEVFGTTRNTPHPRCPVGSRVQGVLDRHLARARSGLEHELARTSIADVLAGVRTAKRS